MNLTKTTAYGALILVLCSVIFNAYLIRMDAGGTALWSSRQAYFFIGVDARGRHLKWIGYPLLIVEELLGRIEEPDDDRISLLVIRVSDEGEVERHTLPQLDRRPGSGPSLFTPIEGRIWVNYPALGGICWWAGNHFEPATPEETAKLGGLNGLNNRSYIDANGWSKTDVSGARTESIKLENDVELFAGGGSARDSLKIEMHKRGDEPIVVLDLNVKAGLVTSEKYQATFHGPQ